jgi:hypothetical protein
MKTIIALAALLAATTAAYASCTTHTYFLQNGKIVTCTTCCNGGHCTTNCF